MRLTIIASLLTACLLLINACDLSKDIEVALPSYENELVVESYLQVDQPYRLLLTRSAGYFDAPGVPLVDDATVVITHNGLSDTLRNEIFIDQESQQIFNYISDNAPSSYDGTYELEITGPQGDQVTASTEILQQVPIIELELVNRTEDSLVVLLTRIADPTNETNFYRRNLHLGKNVFEGEVEQDFTASDRFLENDSELVFGTSYKYAPGDTLISTLYHITEDYYEFARSLRSALNSNGNPFVPQESTRSNIVGGIGIFTGFSFDRKTIVVP